MGLEKHHLKEIGPSKNEKKNQNFTFYVKIETGQFYQLLVLYILWYSNLSPEATLYPYIYQIL